MKDFQTTINRFESGDDLNSREAAEVFEQVVGSEDSVAVAAVLKAWAKKGVTSLELTVCASLMRRQAKSVRPSNGSVLDIVGTGGSKSKLYNISTAAALIAAGAGVQVAKHGNRAATSKTGSADALTMLGVTFSRDAAQAEKMLNDFGICFMFAPYFHNLKPELAAARGSLSMPTIFNQLGPIVNPAAAEFQLIGVWDSKVMKPMASAIRSLGTRRTWLVHGDDGLDEISIAAPTRVAEISNNQVRFFKITPEEFGLVTQDTSGLLSPTPERSAEVIKSVIRGDNPNSPESAIAILNASAAIFIAGAAPDFKTAVKKAEESITKGQAAEKLEAMVREGSN